MSKQIDRVCHSSKDTETLTISRLMDDETYEARKLETLMYGYYKKRIPVRLFRDSMSTLE